MAKKEEYQKVLELLADLKLRVASERIRFADLGADLIAEIIDAGFEKGASEEEQKAKESLIEAYVQQYKTIVKNGDKATAVAYLENIICSMRAWMLLVLRQEKEVLENLKSVQKDILPEQAAIADEKRIKHIRMDVREIFLQQNDDMLNLNYQRLDVVIKYMAIENYFGKNEYGFAMYQKLQALRSRQSANMPEYYEELSKEVFLDLIKSVELNSWDDTSEISVDSRLLLADGAHRLAVSLYFGIPKIRVQVIEEVIEVVPFTVDYLAEGGFTAAEIEIVQNKARELLEQCKVNISCVLWPPAEKYFHEITKMLPAVYKYKDYIYSEETFARIVRAIYRIDDIADWKIQMKIDAMSRCPVKKIRLLELSIFAPRFRLKQINGHTLSVVGEDIKQIVREKYSPLIENYVYDIIIHTGDNFKHSEYICKLFAPAFSVEQYLNEIVDVNYFLIKHEAPYMPVDFPKNYAFSKDIDIVCAQEQYEELKEKTVRFLKKEVKGYDIRIIQTEAGVLFRVELEGVLIIQLDLSTGISGIKPEFWKIALAEKEARNGYYVPREIDEICIRANEYLKQPEKLHHLTYLTEHKHAFDIDYVFKYLQYSRDVLEKIEM